MRKLLKKPGFLLWGCYGLALAAWLLFHLGGLAAGQAAYAAGALEYAELTADDFELYGLEAQPDGRLLTTDGDPQMVLRNGARQVESLVLEISYARAPAARCVFWAAPGQAWSLRRVAWPGGAEENYYLLPPAGGQSLRIDPDSAPGNLLRVERIAVNTGRPFYAYFIPSAAESALVLAVPGVLASALYSLRKARLWPRSRARKAGDAL